MSDVPPVKINEDKGLPGGMVIRIIKIKYIYILSRFKMFYDK